MRARRLPGATWFRVWRVTWDERKAHWTKSTPLREALLRVIDIESSEINDVFAGIVSASDSCFVQRLRSIPGNGNTASKLHLQQHRGVGSGFDSGQSSIDAATRSAARTARSARSMTRGTSVAREIACFEVSSLSVLFTWPVGRFVFQLPE